MMLTFVGCFGEIAAEPILKTRITELFGIRHPIIQGGMHFVGFAELAAATSPT